MSRRLLLCLALVSCDGASRGTDTVRYVLDWDPTGIAAAPTGGWCVHTDLGYEVCVDAGWLQSHSLQLVECPRTLAGVLGIGVAYAGHGETPNPVAVHAPHRESLTDWAPFVFGERDPAAGRYCKVHYLIAGAETGGQTLHVEGRWRRGVASGTLLVESSLAWGALREIPATEGRAVVVRAVRALATAFDGIDFEADPPDDFARAVLRNLLVDTRFQVD